MDDSPLPHNAAPPLDARKPWIALLLSLPVAGLGHLYAGRGRRGVVLLVLTLLFVPSVYLLALLPPSMGIVYALTGVVAFSLGLALFALIDAFRVAKRAEVPYVRRAYNNAGLYLLLIGLTTAWSFLGRGLLKEDAFEVYFIPTQSMQPTIAGGDRVLVNKHLQGQFQRGDVIVFSSPEEPRHIFLKRLVGLPGERIRMDAGGAVWIDERAVLREPLGQEDGGLVRETYDGVSYAVREHESEPPSPAQTLVDLVIPAGHVFVLGDNRDLSRDSRTFGPIPIGSIEGVAQYVFAHGSGHIHVGTALAPGERP